MYQTLQYIGIVLFVIIVYELLRALIVGWIGQKLRHRILQYVRTERVRVDRFKLTGKAFIKAELLADPGLHHAIADAAEESKRPVDELLVEVDQWLDEIIPAFNLVSYYQIGTTIARAVINTFYDVVIDQKQLRRIEEKISKGNVVIYVSNHRSNADYVLLTYALMRSVAISYAVGEWARVFPLDVLFRSFGSYFVRRGFKNPLYHRVLERYVQIISLRGVTQAIFPEGGLSRDGKLRPPKLGLLDYICRIVNEPDFSGDVLFVPVGVNFDWVLEDERLIQEIGEKPKPPGFLQKVLGFFLWLVRFPFLVLLNLFRFLRKGLRNYGYAAVSAGEPISLRSWLSTQEKDILSLPREERAKYLYTLADNIMSQIETAVPITPVPLVALALERLPKSTDWESLLRELSRLRNEAKRQNFPLIEGNEFVSEKESRDRLEQSRENRRKELLDLEEDLIEQDAVKITMKLGLQILQKRGLIEHKEKRITVKSPQLISYYANSLDHLRQKFSKPVTKN